MNLTQQRFLLNRLYEAKRSKPSRYGSRRIPDPPKPARVKQAEKSLAKAQAIIKAWGVQCDRSRDVVQDRVEAEFHKAKEAILFLPIKDAIAAVERFEKAKF